MKAKFLFLFCISLSFYTGFAQNTYVVSNTGDNGTGTLRQAILNLNSGGSTTAVNKITFNIPGSGVQTITLNTFLLPKINKPVIIDGYSQPGSSKGTIELRTILIEIDGGGLISYSATNNGGRSDAAGLFQFDASASGITNTSTGRSAIDGLAIGNTGVTVSPILFQPGASNIQIWGNYIGTRANGVTAWTNGFDGITVSDFQISTSGTYQNIIIGKDPTNSNNFEGNIISNNQGAITGGSVYGGCGVYVGYASLSNTNPSNYIFNNLVIAGNYIGLNTAGAVAFNGPNGLSTSSNSSWRGEGVFINQAANGSNITIGTNGDGNGDVYERNIISGNQGNGILLHNNNPIYNVSISGNYIGTDPSGTLARPNATFGNSNSSFLSGINDFNTTSSNILIGVDESAANPSAMGNVISGNNYRGISLRNLPSSASVVVAGNNIGTNGIGTSVLANGQSGSNGDGYNMGININACLGGVRIGTNANGTNDIYERNIISGNRNSGIDVWNGSQNVVIAGNYIGVGTDGNTAIGNGWAGVNIGDASSSNNSFNRIGSNDDGVNDYTEANIIAYNGNISSSAGVSIYPGNNIQNRISHNNFSHNKTLPIDLKFDGVTVNTGSITTSQSNILMNYPVITNQSIIQGSGASVTGLHVRGYVGNSAGTNPLYAGVSNTISGTINVQLYKLNDDGDQNGAATANAPAPNNLPHGEGSYIGGFAFSADGISNIFDANVYLTSTISSTDKLTAIAIDANGNTSEFGVFATGVQPLPVSLLNYTATSSNCQAIVNWTGAVENNFNHYEVQLSIDGNNFTTLRQVFGKGNGSNYTVQFPLTASVEYIQLKMVDNNNTVTYSNILSVNSNCAANAVPLAYPNPASDQFTLKNMGTVSKDIQVIALNGAVVYKIQTSSRQLNINTQSWSEGIYLVFIKNENGNVSTLKVIVKR